MQKATYDMRWATTHMPWATGDMPWTTRDVPETMALVPQATSDVRKYHPMTSRCALGNHDVPGEE
jgi:hypothetical protein